MPALVTTTDYAGHMTRRRKYPPDVEREGGHEPIAWSHFDPTGMVESHRSGWIWSAAPAIKGNRSFWVVPIDRDHSEPWAIVVTVVSRRRQVGRSPNGRYRPTGGRVIDQGELISEAHPDSPTGALTATGRTPDAWTGVIATTPIPAYIYDTLSKPR